MNSTSQNSSTASSGSNGSSINIQQSQTDVNNHIQNIKDIEEMNIDKLKHILNNPTYNVFDSNCVRKKSNWSKLSRQYKFDNPFFNPKKLLNDLPIVSPKLNKLLSTIDELDKADMRNYGKLFKHFIFSNLKGSHGAKVVTSALIAKGMNLAYNASVESSSILNEDDDSSTIVKYGKINLTSEEKLLRTRHNNFYLLSSVSVFDQPLNVSTKKKILSTFNSRPDNVNGEIARIIVMDSGFKEGIDLFDIKYIHIFEPQSTTADQKQVIGRGTRTCGQKGLVFHPTMGWSLFVFNYDVEINEEYRNSFNNSNSAFDLYLKTLNIDLRLFNFLSEIENMVVLGAVDYELTRNIHTFSVVKPSTSNAFDSLYSTAKTIDSLKSSDFKVSESKNSTINTIGSLNSDDFENYSQNTTNSINNIIFPKTPTGFKETRKFIRRYFSQFEWKNVKMENLCGYAGPPLNKKRIPLPPNPLSKNNTPLSNANIQYDSDKSSNYALSPLTQSTLSEQIVNNKSPASSNTKSSNRSTIKSTTKSSNKSSNRSTIKSTTKSSNKSIYKTPYITELNIYDIFKNNNTTKKLYGGVGNILFGGKSSIVNLSPSQSFIKSYFTPQIPQKGMLLNWSVGTGKTCAAIATATSSFESAGYTILWVTRTTLKNDIWKNMFEQVCSDRIRAIIENANASDDPIPANQVERMKLLSKSWSIRPMSYKQFSNLVSKQNNFYKSLVKKNGTADPLHKTLLIIDEAHKLYGGNDLSTLERPDMDALHKALMNSYLVSGDESVRVLLMTATPITVSPMELIKLLNLCKTPDQQMPENFEEFAERFSLTEDGTFSPKGKNLFLDEIAGYISYLNREKDARQFSQPILKQVAVPLVSTEEIQLLIENYDLRGHDSEEIKITNKLEDEIEKQKKTLDDWTTVSTKTRFAPFLEKCNGLQKNIKNDCINTIKIHINEIIETSKRESAIIKDRIKEIKNELNEMDVFKKEKINKIRKNIKNAGEDYEKFKDTLYNNLKNVCSKKINDLSNLKEVTEELPEIIQINTLITEMDENIKQVMENYKNKILAFKRQIEVLKQHIKDPKLSNTEKNNIKTRINSENKRAKKEIKIEKRNVNNIIKQLNISKKSYEKDKKKLILNVKKTYKKELTQKERNIKKTLKLTRKLEDINVEKETEELKQLIADKKAIIEEEVDKFMNKHKEHEIIAENETKRKEELKRKKEEEKEELKRKKEEEKEELKRKKEEEKEELKRKKEEENAKKEELKRKKQEEKEELKRKKEEEKAKKEELKRKKK
jgi:hypothetical protein